MRKWWPSILKVDDKPLTRTDWTILGVVVSVWFVTRIYAFEEEQAKKQRDEEEKESQAGQAAGSSG